MPARLRGLLVLALVSLLGYGLSRLRDVRGPRAGVIHLRGDAGPTVIVAIEERWPFAPPVRLILSREASELDPERWLLSLPGSRRVMAPGWPAALVEAGGRVRLHPLRLRAEEARDILERASRAGGGAPSFAAARSEIEALDPRLRGFWDRLSGG